jgi:hypothetical protein
MSWVTQDPSVSQHLHLFQRDGWICWSYLVLKVHPHFHFQLLRPAVPQSLKEHRGNQSSTLRTEKDSDLSLQVSSLLHKYRVHSADEKSL